MLILCGSPVICINGVKAILNIIREHKEFFPDWQSSPVTYLYTPEVFENKKTPPLIGYKRIFIYICRKFLINSKFPKI
jgi:hypothetical protein